VGELALMVRSHTSFGSTSEISRRILSHAMRRVRALESAVTRASCSLLSVRLGASFALMSATDGRSASSVFAPSRSDCFDSAVPFAER
jgi:hypothetical protein